MTDIVSSKIGVAGCGAMGRPMAENLIAKGFDVLAYDIRPVSEFDDFAQHMTTDPAPLAKLETVILVVRDAREVNDVLFEAQSIMQGTTKPKTIVLSSTLSPRFVVEVSERLHSVATVIDAPMSGAPYRAREGTLTFMVGGDSATVAGLGPAFEAMGDVIHHLGQTGAGAATKVANNLCAAAGVVAVRRALAAASAYGIQRDQLLDVMRTSSGSTWYGDNLDKIDWAREGYQPENTMGILEKDVTAFVDALTGVNDITGGPFEDAILSEIRRMEALEWP